MYELFESQRAKAILNKIAFVFTPKHGSWLNMAEIEIGVLKCSDLSEQIYCKKLLILQTKLFQKTQKCYSEQGGLAVYHRRCSYQTQTSVSGNPGMDISVLT